MIELIRFGSFKDRTVGRLTYNDEHFYTIEKPWADKSVSIPRSSEQIHGKLQMLLAGVIYSFMSLILASMLLVVSVLVWVYFLSCKAYQAAERQLKTFT
jgi:hypothetical protein